MPKICSVAGCTNYHMKKENVSFFKFPDQNTDPDRRHKWVRACCRQNPDGSQWFPTAKYVYVCSEHFVNDLMHKICGTSIARSSGEVIFDANKLPDTLKSCRITVTTEPFPGRLNSTAVMFYFTKFQLKENCNDTILAISDVVNVSKPFGKGRTLLLDGHCPTTVATGTVFATSGDTMNVSFTGRRAGNQCSVYVSFKYSRIHRGTCDINKEVECTEDSTGHSCIEKAIVCNNKINFCWDLKDSACSSNLHKEKLPEYVRYILCALLGVFMLCGIKFFYGQYRKGRRRNDTCLSSIKQRYVGGEQSLPNDRISTFESYSTLRESSQSIGDRERVATDLVSANIQLGNVTPQDNATLPPSAPTLDDMEPAIPELERTTSELERAIPEFERTSTEPERAISDMEHDIPETEDTVSDSMPPTYDEAVAPSYSEVMANQYKYIVHS